MNESTKKVKRCTKAKALPPLAYLNECFTLDAEAGTLTWKVRPLSHFNGSYGRNIANAQAAGKVAGNNTGRYRQVLLKNRRSLVHRILYYMHTGVDPASMHIDHINGARYDNRIANLRLATHAENGQNRTKLAANNVTGYRGVGLRPSGRFRARVKHNGKISYFGTHDTAEQANQAAIAGRAKLFGEFA